MPKYLVACVRNRARTVIREKQALDRKRAGKAEGGAAEQNDASSAMESDDESAKLMDLLAGLPADLREVLALRMWGGLKFREIEVETGLSKSIVYKRYQEAIAALRRRMAKE